MNEQAFRAADPPSFDVVPVRLPGRVSALYRDFLRGEAKLAPFFGPAFDDGQALADTVRRLLDRDRARDRLAAALARLAAAAEAPRAAAEQIDLLRRSETVAVFAGQQAGLFTGPLYAVYKALTAERWAADLARLLRRPVVACYWLADEDHDFAEVDHIEIPVGSAVRTVRYAPTPAPAGAPVARVIIDRGIEAVIDELADTLPASQHRTGVVATLRETYAPGSGFSSAFARLWYRMFPGSRLVFVSPSDETLKILAAPCLQRAVADHATLFSAYEDASARLAALGYHRQVFKRPAQTFLFHERGRRYGVLRDAHGHYLREGAAPVTAERLQEEIRERPADFSPNVLLRPVVQNALFPVLGVVLGPAETAYQAQIGGLFDHFGIPRPAVLPRTGVTIVEQDGVDRPPGELQERRFNILYYWTRYGPQLLAGLQSHWPPAGRDHFLLQLA
jgi:bacillithiol biosynthesis cysteine-adding enzyme BshC